MFWLDSNIFVRYLARDDEVKFQACARLFSQISAGEIKARTIESVLIEVIYVLTSKRGPYQLDRSLLASQLLVLLSLDNLQMTDKTLCLRALDLYTRTDLDIVDCLLAVNLEKQDTLYSYDRDFDRLDELRQEP